MSGSDHSTHDLLLALAGHVDDDLLAWGRELVAVGEDGHAVELLTATLIAGRTILPASAHAAVVDARPGGRTELDAHGELPPATTDEGSAHVFDSAAGAATATDRIRKVLGALPAPRLAGCRLWLTWRLTPAGSAPGPLPHAVVLVEVAPGPWARATDALAYQLAVTLDRAGAPASVEVFTVGVPLPDYHVSALRSARALITAEAPAARQVTARRAAGVAAEPVASPVPRRAPQPAPDVEPAAGAVDTAPPRPAGAPLARPTSPRRIPTYRTGPMPVARPPADTDDAEPGPPPVAEPEPRAPASSPDPLSGPPHGPVLDPLLDPLLDPEIDEDDPLGLGLRPLSGGTGPMPRTWADDWESGAWESGAWTVPAPAPGRPEAPIRVPASPGPGERPGDGGLEAGPRHRSPGEEGGPDRPTPVEADTPPAPPSPVPGPSPESLARLSSTERQLLAMLQAELAAREHHPRPGRRVGVVRGNGSTPHPPDRPDPAT